MTQEITNMTAVNIGVDATSGQYKLVVKEPSIFDPNGTMHEITLWSRDFKTKQVNPEQVELTQAALRETFGDDTIVFADPTAGANDPNHIGFWLKNHPNAPLKTVFLTDRGYYTISQGTQNNTMGDSKWIKSFDEVVGQPYSQEYRMGVIDALPADLQTQFDTLNGPNIRSSKSGYTTLSHDAVIKDVVFTNANDQNAHTTNYTKDSLKQAILLQLQMDPSTNLIADQIKALPQDYAFIELLDLLGGFDARNLPNSSPARNSLPGILQNAARVTMRFYAVNPQTGVVFQTSQLKGNNGKHFVPTYQTLNGALDISDVNAFIKDAVANGLNAAEAQQILIDNGMFDPTSGQFKYNTPQLALDAFRALFNKREVSLETFITSSPQAAKSDRSKAGAKVVRFGQKVAELPEYKVEEVNIVMPSAFDAPTPAPAPVQEPVAQPTVNQTAPSGNATNPFEASAPAPTAPVQAPTQPAVADPFAAQPQQAPVAPAQETVPNPFATQPTADVNETPNPFAAPAAPAQAAPANNGQQLFDTPDPAQQAPQPAADANPFEANPTAPKQEPFNPFA